jgi:hypothetical protein
MPMMPMSMMPMPMTPVPMMPTMPPHFGGHLLRTFLDRRSSGGIAQRQRLGALHGSSQGEQCADGNKAQNTF